MNWREKGLMQVMLDPRDVADVRELAGSIADELLDAAWPDGRVEAVHALFRPVALGVCARYFGFPGPDQQTLSRWTRAVVTDGFANFLGDPDIQAASVQAGGEMIGYLRDRLAAYRARAGRTCPTTSSPGWPAPTCPTTRIVINMAGLPLGFVESAPGAMVEAVEQLLLRPESAGRGHRGRRRPRALRPLRLGGAAVQPALQAAPPAVRARPRPGRRHPARHGDPGGHVRARASPASAMFDADVVPEPDAFRLDRPGHHQLFFGYGHHACLGVHPARVVIAETVRRLLLRPGVRLLPPPEGRIERAAGSSPTGSSSGSAPKGRRADDGGEHERAASPPTASSTGSGSWP